MVLTRKPPKDKENGQKLKNIRQQVTFDPQYF